MQKREKEGEENGGGQKDDSSQKKDCAVDSSFVFGQNIKERAKVSDDSLLRCLVLYLKRQIGMIEVPIECLCLFSDSVTVFFLSSWMKTARPVTQKTPHKILSLAAPIISYSTWAALGNDSVELYESVRSLWPGFCAL